MKYWQVMALVEMDELPILARKAEEFGFEGMGVPQIHKSAWLDENGRASG